MALGVTQTQERKGRCSVRSLVTALLRFASATQIEPSWLSQHTRAPSPEKLTLWIQPPVQNIRNITQAPDYVKAQPLISKLGIKLVTLQKFDLNLVGMENLTIS